MAKEETTDKNSAEPERKQSKRLTLSEIVEALLARSTADHTAVSLTRNAKGVTQVEVVVRSSEGGEITTPGEAAAKALELYEQLCARYPLPEGYAHTGEVASK